MAIYTYKCSECGKLLEREFNMGENPEILKSFCEKTNKNVKCKRVYTPIGFIMKGYNG